MPEICRFDPSGCGFPAPRVPLLPAPGWAELSADGADRVPPQLLSGPGVRRFARGRYALRAAFAAAGLGPGGLLLAPSYHCRTILDPALALGAQVALYPLHEDLRPDLSAIEALVAGAGAAARVLLVPHYFGIEQPHATMESLGALCARHGLVLVEDCAHAWMVAQRRALAGLAPGRMLVASPYKYFACPDGGLLWGDPGLLPSQGGAPGLMAELRAVRALTARPAQALPAALPSPQAGSRGVEHRGREDGPSRYYDAALERRDALLLTRWLVERAQPEEIARRRRRRYRQWLDASAGWRRARALAPALPDDCAPYMFPLLIERPDPDFFRLKAAGLPIWRWDDMAVSECAIATRYRSRLLQLPCHQGLSDAQMDWMLNLTREVLA
jgi:hypothetical protein